MTGYETTRKKVYALPARLCAMGIMPGMLFLAGCTNRAAEWAEKVTVQRVQMPTECTGWEKLELKNRTRYYLMQNDPRLAVNIDSHNLRGRQLGCWE